MKGDRQFKDFEEELIIRGAYGELNFFEKRKLKKLLKNVPEYADVFAEYKKSAETIKQDNSATLSAGFEKNLYIKLGISEKNKRSLFNDILTLFVEKPVKFAGAFSVIIFILFASVFTDMRIQEREYSDNEIIAANREASEALLLISRMFNETSEEFAEDILKSRVARPLNKGIGIVNSILTNGDKNEKNNL